MVNYAIPHPMLPRTYFMIPTFQYFRKTEDGCVDICFYDWHYLGEYFPTPIVTVSIHSRTIITIIPQSTLACLDGVEPPTPGFGDQCSTN